MNIITTNTIKDIFTYRNAGKSDVILAEDNIFCIRYCRKKIAGVEYVHLLATHKPANDTRTLLIWDYPTFARQDYTIMALSLIGRLESIANVINKKNEIQ